MRVPPARTIEIPATTTDITLAGGASLLTFYNLTETTGSAGAKARLRNGTNADGAIIASITLNEGESTRDLVPAPWLLANVGLYLEVVTGSVEGAVWVVPETLDQPWALAQGNEYGWLGED